MKPAGQRVAAPTSGYQGLPGGDPAVNSGGATFVGVGRHPVALSAHAQAIGNA